MTHRFGVAFLAAALVAVPGQADDPAAEAARTFAIDASASTPAAGAGGRGKLVVAIRRKRSPWHVDPHAPLKLRLTAFSPGRPAGTRRGRQSTSSFARTTLA